MAASLLVPLFSFTGRAAAAAGFTFLNRYRIDHTYQTSGGGPYISDSFVLTPQSNGTDEWVHINESANDPTICNEYIDQVYNAGGPVGGIGGGPTGKYKLYTQPRVLGQCNPNNDGGEVVPTDITIDTTKANYLLFKTDNNTITTMDGAYTWSRVSGDVSAYPPAQEIYFETSNAISSTTCPSVIIKWNNTYKFGAPYVHSNDTSIVESGPASTYYRNMTAGLTGTSANNYHACFADENLIGHLQSSLSKILGTSQAYWQYQTPKSTGFSPMTNDFVDVNNFIGSQADLNNGISSASASSSITSAAAGAAGTATTPAAPVSDGCPLDQSASMRWLGCSIFATLQDAANKVTKLIDDYLFTNPAIFSTGAQAAATTFRNIGMVLIVVAGLFMVISQALGFEFLDAYTVRKLMPRLGIALIGMALAWPLLKFAVTLTNDLGGLVYSILMDIPKTAGATGSATSLGNSIFGGLTGILVGGALIFSYGPLAALSFIGTILLGLFVAFIVLAIRQLVIFMTIILAPLAIAAYVIPGGQKLWDFWKNTFITTLFMYPLIMGFIGAGAAMSYLIGSAPLGAKSSLLAILVYFAPFFMLPFAFKMAGGLMGTIFSMANDRNRGAFDRLKKFRQGQLEKRGSYYKQRYGDRAMQARASAVRSLNASASKYGGVRGGLLRAAGRPIAGLGGIEDKMSAINARTGKAIQDEIATGADDRIRGLTVDRSMGFATAQSQGLARIDSGRRQWKSLGGKWINESDVVEGQRQWGHDAAAQQAALSYEMRKASSEEEATGISKRYNSLARQQWGMTEAQAGSSWIGASFENQNSRLEYKYTDWANGGSLKRGDVTTAAGEKRKTALGAGLVDEIYDKRGSYGVAQMGSTTIGQLQEAYKDASLMAAGVDANGNGVTYSAEQISAATDQKQKIEAIAETFMHQYGSVGGEADDVARQIASQGAQAGGSRTANTPGAAHTAERVRQLAEMTGVYGAAPSGQYSTPLGRAGSDNPRPQS